MLGGGWQQRQMQLLHIVREWNYRPPKVCYYVMWLKVSEELQEAYVLLLFRKVGLFYCLIFDFLHTFISLNI